MKQSGLANIFVIIFGVIIVIIMFGIIRDRAVPFKNAQIDQSKPYTSCGIEIYSPIPQSFVDNIFEFSGKVTGCGWNIQNGFLGNLQILDSNNNLLTDTVSIPANNDGSFKIKVGLKRPPVGKVGLVYLQSASKLQVASFSIYFKQ